MPPVKRAPGLAPTVAAPGASAFIDTPPASVYQSQEVQFAFTSWPPKGLGGGPYTTAWTIVPDPSSPTSYTYSNVVPVQVSNEPTLPVTFTWDTSEVEPGTYTASVVVTDNA